MLGQRNIFSNLHLYDYRVQLVQYKEMNKPSDGSVYAKLGKRLRTLRTQAKETLAESAGAVEIEVRQLAAYELGSARPSQDVLLLLISHFKQGEEEAARLWDLAGYTEDGLSAEADGSADTKEDSKVLFTDVVDIAVNNFGVVMNFMQSSNKTAPQPVARVGMSREHAKGVLKILQITLAQTEQSSPAANQAASDNSFSSKP